MQCVNPVCRQENAGDRLYCRHCLYLLGAGEVTEGPPPAPDWTLLRLAEVCELLQSNEIQADEFRLWLDQFAAEQEEREAQIGTLYRGIPDYIREDFQEEFDSGLSGVARCRSSLQRLASLDAGAPMRSTIVAALTDYYRGVCDIVEAMEINRRNRDRPLWA